MILDILEEISATRKRTEKQQIIKEYKDNAVLQEVVRLAYDPRIDFYMKTSVPKKTQSVDPAITLSHALSNIESAVASRQLTGNGAVDYVQSTLNMLTDADAEVLVRVIKKDLRCGVGDVTWEEMFGNFRIEPYMQCKSMNEKNLSKLVFPAYSQEKLDGMYANARVYGEVIWLSRNGTVLQVPQQVTTDLIDFTNGVCETIHGELVILNEDNTTYMSREDANPLFTNGEACSDTYKHRVRYIIWDSIPHQKYDDKTPYTTTYKTRLDKLIDMQFDAEIKCVGTSISVVNTLLVDDMDSAMSHFESIVSAGGEGTVVKNLDSDWRNSPNPGWVKFKEVKEADLVVTGYNPGNGKYNGGIGSLICESSDGQLQVGVAGLSDLQRGFVSTDKDVKLLDGFDCTQYNGKLVTVEFNAVIKNKEDSTKMSLFLPRIKKNKDGNIVFREDKSTADTLQQIKDKKMGG